MGFMKQPKGGDPIAPNPLAGVKGKIGNVPRTEFVVVFVWEEPIVTQLAGLTGRPGGAGGAPAPMQPPMMQPGGPPVPPPMPK
jgi:hypothetical protein